MFLSQPNGLYVNWIVHPRNSTVGSTKCKYLMITADYHGSTVEEALRHVARIIGRVRMANQEQEARLITGHGQIQREVIEMLEAHGLEPTIQISNSGVVRVIID